MELQKNDLPSTGSQNRKLERHEDVNLSNEDQPPKPQTLPKAAKEMEVLDLIDDCLCEIFEFLDIGSLTKAAGTCKRFLNVARDVFSRKYGNDLIELTSAYDLKQKVVPSVALLKCFGDLIKTVKVKYDKCDRFNMFLENAIADHCQQSLKAITFFRIPDFGFYKIEKPFVNVESIRFIYRCPASLFPKFNQTFPNAQKYSFVYTSFQVKDIQHFPSATHINLIRPRTISTFLRHQSCAAYVAKEIMWIVENCTELVELSIWSSNISKDCFELIEKQFSVGQWKMELKARYNDWIDGDWIVLKKN